MSEEPKNCRFLRERHKAVYGPGSANLQGFQIIYSCDHTGATVRMAGRGLVSLGPDGWGCHPAKSRNNAEYARGCGPTRPCYVAPDEEKKWGLRVERRGQK